MVTFLKVIAKLIDEAFFFYVMLGELLIKFLRPSIESAVVGDLQVFIFSSLRDSN